MSLKQDSRLSKEEIRSKRYAHLIRTMKESGYKEITEDEYHNLTRFFNRTKNDLMTARIGFKFFKINSQQPLKTSCNARVINSYGVGEREPHNCGNGAITNGELEAHQPSLLPADTNIQSKKEFGECPYCGEIGLVSNVGIHFQCNCCGGMWDEIEDNSCQQECNGGQTISVNVGSSRNPLQGKVLASSETSAYGLQATSERGDYKTGSNMETTGDVRLKSSKVVSLLKDGTPRSSPADNTNIQGCGKEILIEEDLDYGEDAVYWKCGEQFNTDFTPYCPECQKKYNQFKGWKLNTEGYLEKDDLL